MYNNDSDSLNAGAPEIRLTGNQQMASYGYDDAMAESRQAYDDARQKGVIPIDMPFEDFLDLMQGSKQAPSAEGIMASAPTGTYTQNRKRQMAAGGGIMGSNNGSMLVAPTADGSRPGYGWLSDLKDKIVDDIIPNEIKENPGVTALLGGAALNQFGIPFTGEPGDRMGQNWLGELLGGKDAV